MAANFVSSEPAANSAGADRHEPFCLATVAPGRFWFVTVALRSPPPRIRRRFVPCCFDGRPGQRLSMGLSVRSSTRYQLLCGGGRRLGGFIGGGGSAAFRIHDVFGAAVAASNGGLVLGVGDGDDVELIALRAFGVEL